MLDLAASTTPAARVRPDSSCEASVSTFSTDCAGGRDLRFDRAAVVLGEVADLHQRIDEEAQTQFGRQPAGRGVRRIDEAELFEVRHDVAHRGGRQRHRHDHARILREPTGSPVAR